MKEFIIRAAKSMPEKELLSQLETALKIYKEKPTPDNRKNIELYNYMVAIHFESSTADKLISELSQFERTKDFFTTNKN